MMQLHRANGGANCISRFGKDSLRLVVIVPDEQGYAYKSQNEFKGYDKDILHSNNGFIS